MKKEQIILILNNRQEMIVNVKDFDLTKNILNYQYEDLDWEGEELYFESFEEMKKVFEFLKKLFKSFGGEINFQRVTSLLKNELKGYNTTFGEMFGVK